MFTSKIAVSNAAIVMSFLLSMPAIAQTSILTGSASASAVSPNLLLTPMLSPQTSHTDVVPLQQGEASYSQPAMPAGKAVNPANAIINRASVQPAFQRTRTAVRVPTQRSAAVQTGVRPAVIQPHHPPLTYWQRHPMVKSATIGAGVGAGAGALTGLVTGRGVLHGAVVGAGAGAGVGVIRSSQIMRRHPIIKNTATGAVAGLGLGLAAGGHHSGLKAAGVGSAIGLGYGLFRYLK